MQTTASLPGDQFSDLLGRLPADLDLDALARQTKAIVRKRKLETGAGLLRLALARGPGGLSLSATAAWATMLGFPSMSDPGVKYRLDKAVDFLEAVMTCQLAAKSPGASVRWPGRILRASDGSCISKRGSKGTDWRVHAVYDLGRGGFSHLDLTDGHNAEAIDRGAPVAGEIRIGDRNYASAPSLQRFRQQSANQADFIVRVRWNGFSLRRPDGRDFDLIEQLGTLPNNTVPHEVMVEAKVGPLDPLLPLRLIIQRKSPEATEATRRKLRSEASRKQKTLGIFPLRTCSTPPTSRHFGACRTSPCGGWLAQSSDRWCSTRYCTPIQTCIVGSLMPGESGGPTSATRSGLNLTRMGSNPLDRFEKFQVTSPFSFPGLILSQGSCTPSRPSADPPKSWPISAATPTGSPSPTLVWSA
jgi:hypothetical protein